MHRGVLYRFSKEKSNKGDEKVDGKITTLTVTGGKVATVVYTDGKKICTYKAELAESDNFSDGHYNVIDAKTSK